MQTGERAKKKKGKHKEKKTLNFKTYHQGYHKGWLPLI